MHLATDANLRRGRCDTQERITGERGVLTRRYRAYGVTHTHRARWWHFDSAFRRGNPLRLPPRSPIDRGRRGSALERETFQGTQCTEAASISGRGTHTR